MTITIIGCGWLGLPLAEKLAKAEHKVYGSMRTEETFPGLREVGVLPFLYDSEKETPIPDKITSDTDILILTLPPIRRDVVSHYGKVLSTIVKQFGKVKQVIFTSSIGIYPKQSGIYREDFHFLEAEKQTSLYIAETTLQKAAGKKLTILRLGGLFGKGRHPVFHLAGNTEVKNPFGLVNLVHLDDVIGCIQTCIKNEQANGVFNVVFPDHPFRKEYYTKLFRQHGLPAIGFIDSPTIERRIPVDKLVNTLPFEFRHSIYDLGDCL